MVMAALLLIYLLTYDSQTFTHTKETSLLVRGHVRTGKRQHTISSFVMKHISTWWNIYPFQWRCTPARYSLMSVSGERHAWLHHANKRDFCYLLIWQEIITFWPCTIISQIIITLSHIMQKLNHPILKCKEVSRRHKNKKCPWCQTFSESCKMPNRKNTIIYAMSHKTRTDWNLKKQPNSKLKTKESEFLLSDKTNPLCNRSTLPWSAAEARDLENFGGWLYNWVTNVTG